MDCIYKNLLFYGTFRSKWKRLWHKTDPVKLKELGKEQMHNLLSWYFSWINLFIQADLICLNTDSDVNCVNGV